MKPITKWQANDGTIFDTLEECITYDDFEIFEFTDLIKALTFLKKEESPSGQTDNFVYMFFQYGICLYVGRSNKLRSRLSGHRSTMLGGSINVHVKLIRCPDKETTSYIERYFIGSLQPRNNKYSLSNAKTSQ